jgi:hypothetical protein
MKHITTIRRQKAKLRKLIDECRPDDPVLTRIAYAMEQALVWAAYNDVKGWPLPDKLARDLAGYLRRDLGLPGMPSEGKSGG